jgi:hypothetical protein
LNRLLDDRFHPIPENPLGAGSERVFVFIAGRSRIDFVDYQYLFRIIDYFLFKRRLDAVRTRREVERAKLM